MITSNALQVASTEESHSRYVASEMSLMDEQPDFKFRGSEEKLMHL